MSDDIQRYAALIDELRAENNELRERACALAKRLLRAIPNVDDVRTDESVARSALQWLRRSADDE